jgi:protein required for attachment to host cells
MELKNLQEHIRTLATLAESDAEVISCYLALAKAQLTNRNAFDEQVRSLRVGLAGKDRSDFETALDRIEAYLKTELSLDAKGIALFSRSGEEPFFLPLQFRVPLPNWVAVDTTPNIYHLVELKDTYHRYVVMISTEESVRILEVNLGAVTEQLWKERPELRKRVGREWTKNHYQNHRRDRTGKFIKEKINILDRLMSAGGYGHLILAGDPRMTARVRDQLPKHLQAKLVDVVPAALKTPVADVVEATIASFIEEEENESRLAVDELVQAVHTGGLAVSGTEPVFRALERGQIDTLILAKAYEPDKGWQCSVCDMMNVHQEKPEKCPKCEASELREFDVKEEMVRLAEREGCEIEVVEHSDKLRLLGGVGCLLRYRLPEEYSCEPEDRAVLRAQEHFAAH